MEALLTPEQVAGRLRLT
ncbi:MAG: hypothetical protein QG597_5028, partial [Actinomycetota bacterium]|nr:hypothetical protein [Actinomycetota bacterium]